MKKIFSIFLCSALIFSAVCGLGISASAEETTVNPNNLAGIWVFNDTLNFPTSTLKYEDYFEFMNGRTFNWDADPYLMVDSTGFYFINCNGSMGMYTSSNPTWQAFFGNSIYFTKSDTSSSFFKWVKANATKVADSKPTHCNGSMCSTTPDENGDNICDTCNLPFVFSLRNDTYDYNGYTFAYYFENIDGVGQSSTLDGYLNLLSSDGDMIILASSDNFDSALLYTFSSPVKIVDGKLYTSAQTVVSLYVPRYTEDGSPYWKRNGTESWGADAYISTLEQVHWSADDLSDSSGVVLNGDSNFMIPLWEKVEIVTQGAIPMFSQDFQTKMTTLVVFSVGLVAFGILLYLLVKTLRKSLQT